MKNQMHHYYKVIPKATNLHNIIKFQARADSHVNFPYHETGPLALIGQAVSEKTMFENNVKIHVFSPGAGNDTPWDIFFSFKNTIIHSI